MLFRFFENLTDPFDPAIPEQPPKGLAAFVWHYSKPFKWLLLAATVTSALVGLIEVWAFDFVGRAIDWMTEAESAQSFMDEHGRYVVLAMIFLAVAWPLLTLLDDLLALQGLIVPFSMNIRWRGHRYLLRQSTSFFASDYAGRVTTKLMQTALGVREVMQKFTGLLAYMAVYFLATVVMFFAADWRLAIPVLIWLGLYSLMMRLLLPRLSNWSQKAADARSVLTGRIVDAYTNIQTVKLFATNRSEETYARESMEDAMTVFQHQFRVATVLSTSLHALNAVLVATTLGLGIWLWDGGFVSVGAVALSGALVLRLQGLSHYFLWELSGLFENIGAVQDGIGTLANPISVRDSENAAVLNVTGGGIEFDRVSFDYGSSNAVLKDLSLSIAPGEKVGIVGRSGAGKSTLMSLLLRLYELSDGTIRIDGQDIAVADQETIRHQIAVVTQDTSLLHRSIRENIGYGRPEATEADIIKAAQQAEAWPFIQGLTDQKGRMGLDALVGERGVKLSGGQRQRVAIARVILKDAPILLLDEATSALDSEVEAAIQSQLTALMDGKTVLAIAHRLSTIASMDRLIVMEAGQIVEQGTHEELVAHGGIYADLWSRQSGGFIFSQAQAAAP